MVLGTRPEIIKMAPVIRALKESGTGYYVLHTGQHYSRMLDEVFFDDLQLGEPDFNLRVGSGTHAEETARMLVGVEKTLSETKARGVLVEGDTNSVLAGALAASKLGVLVGHVEAGLRSGDRKMPEELNRIVTDHLSDKLFAPTRKAKDNLLKEGVQSDRIFVTGNTVVDAIKQNVKIAEGMDVDDFVGTREDYILATVHRQENVDDRSRLRKVVKGLHDVGRKTGLPVVFPAHPRSVKAMGAMGVRVDAKVLRVKPPASYLQFLKLESDAKLILTDSGGVQEEACILGVPCVTLRDSTERPETIDVGANTLAGWEPGSILGAATKMIQLHGGWKNPFGDGRAAERIVRAWNSP